MVSKSAWNSTHKLRLQIIITHFFIYSWQRVSTMWMCDSLRVCKSMCDTWHMMDAFPSAHLSMWKITLHVYSIRRWNAFRSFARNKEMIWCDWAHRLFYVVRDVVEYILAILGDIKCEIYFNFGSTLHKRIKQW